LQLTDNNPEASFFKSFAATTLVGPSISALFVEIQPFDEVSTVQVALLVFINVIISLPIALVLAPLAAVSAVTINSPSFFSTLVNVYEAAVPESVRESKKTALSAFLAKLEKVGLSGILVKDSSSSIVFSIIEFALFFLTPFFAIFLNSVGKLCTTIKEDDNVEMGPAIVDTVLDAAEGVIFDFLGFVSSGYVAVITLVTIVFCVLNRVF